MIKNQKRSIYNIPPMRIIASSFALVIVVGTLLLTLPISSKAGTFTPIVDCLFTATSATCVTGLIIYDTFTHWSPLGQGVILMLIQIGGLGLVTFASLFNIAIGKKLGLRGMQLAKESVNTESVADIHRLIKTVFLICFAAEAVGAFFIGLILVPIFGSYGVFMSIFTSVSAFCNAGFDLMGIEKQFSSLTAYTHSPTLTLTVAALIVVGGLGFIVWRDILLFRKTHKLQLHTKIVLVVTGILIFVGTLVFIVGEWNNPATMGHLSFGEKLMACIFQSITTRTAGFNSIDLAALRDSTKVFSIILMFIGAAPGSTGGGIKVTTVAVLVMTVLCVIFGKDETIISHRKVNKNTVYKAMSITILAIVAVWVAATILIWTSPIEQAGMSGLDAVFESVSAFATVGLSVGPTSVATLPSKLVLVLTMFIGRVGPVSFMLSLAMRNPVSRKEIIPDAKIIVG